MQYRNLGKAGVKVSPVCLGTMMFGGPTDEAQSIRIIHEALGRGINFLDTANVYVNGESEVVVGKAIAGRRDDVVLATKGRSKRGDFPNQSGASRLHMMRELEGSLKRLGVERIDIYYLHHPDYQTPIEETLRAMDDMVRQGKVHYLACSNFRAWRLCEALWISDRLNLNPFVCVQPLYNIMNRDIEVELLPLCEAHGIGVVSYSPLARGILTGKYKPGEPPPEGSRASRNDVRIRQAEWREASLVAAQEITAHCGRRGVNPSQFALAWCLANPILTSIIVGPRTMEQFLDNLGCLDLTITQEDEDFIDRLVPPGDHSGKGFQDTAYPVLGRPRTPVRSP
jgi:aryl-alcohol dehydrogenase-like predicted oxidoreductase